MGKERPILFSAPMVRAILDGQKTQTRRVVKPQPVLVNSQSGFRFPHMPGKGSFFPGEAERFCPYGQPGDHLWVRETWREDGRGIVTYRATDPETAGRWKPSIHMPRRFSRIDLLIKDIRARRLQEISDRDAIAEGVGHGLQ